MDCKKIQEFLLTDYADNEMTTAQKQLMEEHLKTCLACRQFAAEVKQLAVSPFEDLPAIKAPKEIWENVRASIEPKERPENIFINAWEGWKDLIAIRRPIFALSTVMALLLVILVFSKMPLEREQAAKDSVNTYLSEQAEYLAYLQTDGQDVDFGTAIEEYFL